MRPEFTKMPSCARRALYELEIPIRLAADNPFVLVCAACVYSPATNVLTGEASEWNQKALECALRLFSLQKQYPVALRGRQEAVDAFVLDLTAQRSVSAAHRIEPAGGEGRWKTDMSTSIASLSGR